jgi:bla regulator protein BlaR1
VAIDAVCRGRGLLTLALRKNAARTRYWLWLAASVKFLVPFSILVMAGSHFGRATPASIAPPITFMIEQVSQPFAITVPAFLPAPKPPSATVISTILCAVWAIGFAFVASSWWRRSRSIRAALRGASPLDLPLGIKAMSSPAIIEPGVFGIRRPVLLLPEGIQEHLTAPQLEAIVAHELSHVRRHDNLAALLHMVVETLFWFHPLVWWLGSRLMEERERACDEEVLRSGSEPQVYAEGILKICELYLASPLPCVSGVTGANLKKRIEEIMSNGTVSSLNLGKKLTLATAGAAALAVPIFFGAFVAPSPSSAQSQEAFDVASVKVNVTGGYGGYPGLAPGGQRFTATSLPLLALIMLAYNTTPDRISGVPTSFNVELYDVEASCDRPMKQEQALLMLQTLLADRFKLTLHRETRERPIYALVVGKGGPKFHEAAEQLSKPDMQRSGRGFAYKSAPMSTLTLVLSQQLDRPVVDKTELNSRYDFTLEYARERAGRGVAEGREVAPKPDDLPSIFTAVQEQLGLKLESQKGPIEFIVVDHAEKPSAN